MLTLVFELPLLSAFDNSVRRAKRCWPGKKMPSTFRFWEQIKRKSSHRLVGLGLGLGFGLGFGVRVSARVRGKSVGFRD